MVAILTCHFLPSNFAFSSRPYSSPIPSISAAKSGKGQSLVVNFTSGHLSFQSNYFQAYLHILDLLLMGLHSKSPGALQSTMDCGIGSCLDCFLLTILEVSKQKTNLLLKYFLSTPQIFQGVSLVASCWSFFCLQMFCNNYRQVFYIVY